MQTVDLHDAQTHFLQLADEVATGMEITITKSGKPIAKLVPFSPVAKRPKRALGALIGQANLPADFDAPLSDAVIDDFERR